MKRVNGVQTVGLGNGQKHSEQFEQFVAQHRPRLRELRLCERATQRVLFYSNNFLHRCLKTEPNVSLWFLRKNASYESLLQGNCWEGYTTLRLRFEPQWGLNLGRHGGCQIL